MTIIRDEITQNVKVLRNELIKIGQYLSSK